jgi:catechol 2,3-dioxygenase-like lactoylglutathione lyase family enzyme
VLSMARLGTRDLPRAAVFYDALAQALGAARIHGSEKAVSYRGPDGGIFAMGLPLAGEAQVGNGTQISFAAASRDQVDAAYAEALAAGATAIGAPAGHGPKPYAFYVAYVRDPDGHKLMVYHSGDSSGL